MHRNIPTIVIVLIALLCAFARPAAAASGKDLASLFAALDQTRIDARDLKTLDYLRNAQGQLDEWSLRLLGRLERELGPRESDPILDGRADLQVKKIAVTYAGYTHNAALADVLRALAEAHANRLRAVAEMIRDGVDRNRFSTLDAPIQRIGTHLISWSTKR